MGSDSSSSSSSSSDSSDNESKYKRKEKKDKKHKKDKKQKNKGEKGNSFLPPSFPPPMNPSGSSLHSNLTSPPPYPGFPSENFGQQQQHMENRSIPSFPMEKPHNPASQIPPSGFRLALAASAPFPPPNQSGPPPFFDADGSSPVFVGSALFENSVHPCKICPNMFPACRVPYAGSEHEHHGRYDLLPITPAMEWVITREGQLPPGRRLVEGGYEENGEKLYHAAAIISGVEVPGKTGHHLGGVNIAFGGAEHVVSREYKILCWRY